MTFLTVESGCYNHEGPATQWTSVNRPVPLPMTTMSVWLADIKGDTREEVTRFCLKTRWPSRR